jgi:hypothetical protein
MTDSGCEKIEVDNFPVKLRILDQHKNDVTNMTVRDNREVRAVATIPEDLIIQGSKVIYQLFRNKGCEEAGHDVNFDQKVDVKNSTILSPSDPPVHLTIFNSTLSYKAVYKGSSVNTSSLCQLVVLR